MGPSSATICSNLSLQLAWTPAFWFDILPFSNTFSTSFPVLRPISTYFDSPVRPQVQASFLPILGTALASFLLLLFSTRHSRLVFRKKVVLQFDTEPAERACRALTRPFFLLSRGDSQRMCTLKEAKGDNTSKWPVSHHGIRCRRFRHGKQRSRGETEEKYDVQKHITTKRQAAKPVS